MDIDNLTIGQAKQLAAMFGSQQSTGATLGAELIGLTVIVRTYSAGVFCGVLQQKAGNEVILTGARRMYEYKCAKSISLSGVVVHGIDQGSSRICPPVPTVWLEAIEILPISGAALQSIMEAPHAEAQ